MARKKKTLPVDQGTSEDTMLSEGQKKFLSDIDLKGIEVLNDKVSISKLKSEILALKIRNTELTMRELQHQIDVSKTDLKRSLELEKAAIENAKQNMVKIKSKYGISGQFAYDPISGELITE